MSNEYTIIKTAEAHKRMKRGEVLEIRLEGYQIELTARTTSPALRALITIYNIKHRPKNMPRIIGIRQFAAGYHLQIEGHPGAFLVHADYKLALHNVLHDRNYGVTQTTDHKATTD